MSFHVPVLMSSLSIVLFNLTCIGIISLDPYLEPHKGTLQRRYSKAQEWLKKLDATEGGIEKFSQVRSPSAYAVASLRQLT